MRRFLAARLARPQDADDLTQECLVRAYRGLRSYTPGRPFRPWLYAIARRVWIDAHRRQPAAVDMGDERVDTLDPAEVLARQDAAARVWQRVAGWVTEPQWTCLWLRHQMGLDIREVAAATGYSAIHVKVLLHRARRRLVETLPAMERDALQREIVSVADRVPAVPVGVRRAGGE